MKSDVFILTVDQQRANAWLRTVPTAKIINQMNLNEDAMSSILKQTLTKFFFVIRGEVSPECGINLDFVPDKESKKLVHVWGEQDAIRLYSRRTVKKNLPNYTDDGIRNAKCEIKIVDFEDELFDSDSGWEWFDDYETGIKESEQPFFFVKDTTAVTVDDGFNTSFMPNMWNTDKIHAFQRLNPVNGNVIDYGGIKLYPLEQCTDEIVNVDSASSTEIEYDIIKVDDINCPDELKHYVTENRFVWIVDQYLDISDFKFDHYPLLFDSDLLHIWRTEFGVPSIKLVPVGIAKPAVKEMDAPVGVHPKYKQYTSIEEGYEKCEDPFFWVMANGAIFHPDFREVFYAKEHQDDSYWWKSTEWVKDKISCFQCVDLSGKHHSAEGILFCPNDPTKWESFYVDEVAGIVPFREKIPDVVFLSYDEDYADENYAKLLKRYPGAKRVHGIEGIFEAHKMAASVATTKRFFLVDADAIIEDDFDMHAALDSLRKYPDDSVYVWRSRNPVNGLEYGYGGLKCFPRQKMLDASDWNIDFSTSLSENFVPVPEVSNVTAFNTNELNTWRSAFRECVKLSSKIIHKHDENDTEHWLYNWCNVSRDPVYGGIAIAGARAGKEFGEKYADSPGMLNKINDFEWLAEYYDKSQQEPVVVEWQDLSAPLTELPLNALLLNNLISIMGTSDEVANAVSDMCSKGQLSSKAWLRREIPTALTQRVKNVYLCGGWYGFTANIISDLLHPEHKITSIDIDPSCEPIAKRLNSLDALYGNFNAITADIKDVDYAECDLVINTSCEHIENIEEWYDLIPNDTMVILQSNNYHDLEEHINCVDSEDELSVSCPMNNCIYKGSLVLPNYTRFMVIGIK